MEFNWTYKTIGEVCKTASGGTPSRSNAAFYENGTIPWVKTGELTNKYLFETEEHITQEALQKSSAKMIPANAVIMAMYGATIGKTSIIKKDMSTNQACCAMITNEIELHNEFLYYILSFRKEDIISLGSGGAQPNISQQVIKNIEIPIPPILEQRKIADILSSVDNAISITEAIIEQTEKVKKGVMNQLLTKGIGHKEFKQSEVGEIPTTWEVKELGELADPRDRYSFVGGPFGSDLKSDEYTSEGVRIIQLQNIKDGYFSNDYKIYTSEDKANELIKCNIYPGDIIIAKMAEPVARATIIPNICSRYVMASDGIRLSVDKSLYNTEFVTFSINAQYFRQQAIDNSTGTTRLRIGLTTLRKLKIASPPLKEQIKIKEVLTNIDSKLSKENGNLTQLRTLKKGLMQVLLTGKIRVKVNDQEAVIT
ncbi:restriction endonuclease subunit S [Paenibacillus lactis]|uniref:restriction endonuclease subunit S n=1 Tax=Paenibacillus TaxID=44249 RepID=UPI0011AA2632|nr:restriction endonuclease subunit S [Paenibacillus sp. IHBB 10380]